MELLKPIVLGVLQGVTEFLPISSSGHLVIAEHLFNMKQLGSVAFEVLLHSATLLAIVVYYRRRLAATASYFCGPFFQELRAAGLKQALWINETGRLVSLIIIATIPTALIGLIFEDFLVRLFDMPQIVGVTLCLTGILLISTLFSKEKVNSIGEMGAGLAILIGIAQGLAIMPGISRSGATIAVGILLGLAGREAADFSFLMSIPAVLLATLRVLPSLTIGMILKGEVRLGEIGLNGALGGFFGAFLVGYLSLSVLIKLVRRGKFHYFAFYCFAIGIFSLFYFA